MENGTPYLAVAKGVQSVGRLSGLGDEEADVVPVLNYRQSLGSSTIRWTFFPLQLSEQVWIPAVYVVCERSQNICRIKALGILCVPEDGTHSVQKVGGQVDHDGQFGQFLEEGASGDGRVVGRAAADKE